MNIKKYLAFILMLIGAVVMIAFHSNFGIIFAIAALILSIVYIKQKNVFDIIALVGSIILIVYFVVSLVIAVDTVSGFQDKARQDVVNTYAENLEESVEDKINTLMSNNELKSGENILTNDLFAKYNISYPKKCESYVIANIDLNDSNNNTYKAYVRCDNKYATEGFDDKYLK